jgi:tetratricopeptide (TPR) repeat protein
MYGLNRQSEIPAFMQQASAALEKSDSIKPMPETHALRASALGNLIGADPSLGSTLGPEIQQEMSAAMAAGPTNPRVWLIRGISTIYTPPEYGGGLSEAETQLSKAVALFNLDQAIPPAPSWGRAEAYAWLGQVLQRENKPSEALAAYNRALALEPNYAWVKNGLLPSAKK